MLPRTAVVRRARRRRRISPSSGSLEENVTGTCCYCLLLCLSVTLCVGYSINETAENFLCYDCTFDPAEHYSQELPGSSSQAHQHHFCKRRQFEALSPPDPGCIGGCY